MEYILMEYILMEFEGILFKMKNIKILEQYRWGGGEKCLKHGPSWA